MEVAENAQNKVENETSEIHKSPIKDNVDNGDGDLASKNKPMENNDIQKVAPKTKKMTKLERMSQENAALLKELGVTTDDSEDSGRRRTRSQARGVTVTPTPVEDKPKRGRKPRESQDSDTSASNKKSTSTRTPPAETGQKRGRGRPPKNVPLAKKLKENDKVVDDNVEETGKAEKEEPTHPELNAKHDVDESEKKVEEVDEKKEDEKDKDKEKVSTPTPSQEVTEPEKPKEDPEPKTTTANTEEKTNGEESTEKEKCEKSSEPEPEPDAKPSEGSETLTTPNEN